jgi:hypothetical protein
VIAYRELLLCCSGGKRSSIAGSKRKNECPALRVLSGFPKGPLCLAALRGHV